MLFFKKNYILITSTVLLVCCFGIGNSVVAQEQTTNCIQNSTEGGKTCLPIEGVSSDWQLYTYHHADSLNASHCAIDFYSDKEPTVGSGGDDGIRINYNPDVYALWNGKVIYASATDSSCGRMIRIQTTQEQAGQKIFNTNGDHLISAYFVVEYCHLEDISIENNGGSIDAGTYIGRAGASGGTNRSETSLGSFVPNYWKHITGSHLHLRVRVVESGGFFDIDKRLSIPENVLSKMSIFQGVKFSSSWQSQANKNQEKLCNKYTIDPSAEPLVCISVNNVISTGDPSVVLQKPPDIGGGYYLQTYTGHGELVAPKEDRCIGALDIYTKNNKNEVVTRRSNALEVYSPFDNGVVQLVGNLDGVKDSLETGCGNGVRIYYPSLDLQLSICHLSVSDGSKIPVNAGGVVNKGSVIGYLKENNVGDATSAHIHINMYKLREGTQERVNMLTEIEIATLLGIDIIQYPIDYVRDESGEYRRRQLACVQQYENTCSEIDYIHRVRIYNDSKIFPANKPRVEEKEEKNVTNIEVEDIGETPLQLSWAKINGIDIANADLGGIMSYFFTLILWVAIILTLLSIIYIGFLYIVSQDNPNNLAEAKERLQKIFIGILILLTSYILFSWLGIDPNATIEKKNLPQKVISFPSSGHGIDEGSFEGWYRYIPVGASIREMWTTYNAIIGECENSSSNNKETRENCGGLSYNEGGLAVNEPNRIGSDSLKTILEGIEVCIENKSSSNPGEDEQQKINNVEKYIENINNSYDNFVKSVGKNVKLNELARLDSRKCSKYLGSRSILYTCTAAQEQSVDPTNKKDCDDLYALGEEPNNRIQSSYDRGVSAEELSKAKLDYFCDGIILPMRKIASINVGELMNGPIVYYQPAGYGIIDRKLVPMSRIPVNGNIDSLLRNMSFLRSAVYDLGYDCSSSVDIDQLSNYSNVFTNARQNIYSAMQEIISEEAPIRAEVFSVLSEDDISDYLKGNCIEFGDDGMILQTRIRNNEYASNYEEVCKVDARIIKSVLEDKISDTLQNASPDRRSPSITCSEMKKKIEKFEKDGRVVGESCEKYDSCCPNEKAKEFAQQCEPLDIFKCRARGYDWK